MFPGDVLDVLAVCWNEITKHPLYDCTWEVHYRIHVDGSFALSIVGGKEHPKPPDNIPRQRYNRILVDINVKDGVFYLLGIQIPKMARGQGHGALLYDMCERIATAIGCTRIEQTPSGWTGTGETRASYLARYGWILDRVIAYKELTGVPMIQYYVLYSDELGIYLGPDHESEDGCAFSIRNPGKYTTAPCYGQDMIGSVSVDIVSKTRMVQVFPDTGRRASVDACANACLPRWEPVHA